jgi:hypothetical protein
MRVSRAAVVGVLALAAVVRSAGATPIYAAREGRTCDNCHVSPSRWENPALALRKCNLSCQTCHVDPAGGGMRTTPGRFYGRATLPMVATSPRPTADWDRGFGRWDRATSYTDDIPYGPSDLEASRAYEDSLRDRWAWSRPKGETRHAFFPGRYGGLNPDPVLRIGADIRAAALFSRSTLVFPMQFDVETLLHPVHHVTLFANTGSRGRVSGYSDAIDDSHTPYLREAFLMTHEWPYESYVKTGRFVPSFGLRLDDHTNRIRREFELDGSLPESRVAGVEIGAAPNYPFLQVSYFRMTSKYEIPDPWDIFDLDDGWGTAVNAGYRELGWSAGGSVLLRRRPLDEGGDTDTYALYGAVNLWFYSRRLPVTIVGEVDVGRFQSASGREAGKLVWYAELDWAVRNGVNVLLAYDWADPDRDVRDDHSGRVSLGAQLTVYPGVTLDGRFRFLDVATSHGDDSDLFTQIHIWF